MPRQRACIDCPRVAGVRRRDPHRLRGLTPMLSSELKLGLSDMAGQIETGGLVISTPFDV